MTPNMAWSHDVYGYSPAPNFVEDRMALSLGVKADYPEHLPGRPVLHHFLRG